MEQVIDHYQVLCITVGPESTLSLLLLSISHCRSLFIYFLSQSFTFTHFHCSHSPRIIHNGSHPCLIVELLCGIFDNNATMSLHNATELVIHNTLPSSPQDIIDCISKLTTHTSLSSTRLSHRSVNQYLLPSPDNHSITHLTHPSFYPPFQQLATSFLQPV